LCRGTLRLIQRRGRREALLGGAVALNDALVARQEITAGGGRAGHAHQDEQDLT